MATNVPEENFNDSQVQHIDFTGRGKNKRGATMDNPSLLSVGFSRTVIYERTDQRIKTESDEAFASSFTMYFPQTRVDLAAEKYHEGASVQPKEQGDDGADTPVSLVIGPEIVCII